MESDRAVATDAELPAEEVAQRAPLSPRMTLAAISFVSILYGFYKAPAGRSSLLTFDLGVQFHLSQATAQGAIPIRDFFHAWNAGGWYVGAALYRLVGGNPTLWIMMWTSLTGVVLIMICGAAISLRRGAPPAIAVIAALGTVMFASVPHGKYAVPALWTLAVVVLMRGSRKRFLWGLFAVNMLTFWMHVELSVLCGFAAVLWAFLDEDGVLRIRRAMETAAAVVGAIAVGLTIQLSVYSLLGVAPKTILDQYLLRPSNNDNSQSQLYGWLLGNPSSFQAAILPFAILIPFVPMIFRRLHPATRLVSCVNLAMAVVALQRTDAPHVVAAIGLLPIGLTLVAYDVLKNPPPVRFALRPLPMASFMLGGATMAAAIWTAVDARSLLVLALLGVTAAIGNIVTRFLPRTAWSSGAALALASIALLSILSHEREDLRAGRSTYDFFDSVGAAIGGPVEACSGGSDDVLILTQNFPQLYSTLGLDNPSVYYTYWYGANRFTVPAIVDLIEAGRIDAIVTIPDLPQEVSDIRPVLADEFEVCHQNNVGGNPITIYRYTGTPRNP